LITICGKSSN